MPRKTTTLAVLFFSGSLVVAQQNVQPNPYNNPDPRVKFENIWPQNNVEAKVGSHIFVVTLTKPKKKQSCNVRSIDANQLVCSSSLGRKPTIYRQQDVEALIIPAESTPWYLHLAIFARAGGLDEEDDHPEYFLYIRLGTRPAIILH